MGVWDLFPPLSSSLSSAVRQERDLQPRPAVPTLLCSCVVGVLVGRVAWRSEGAKDLGKLVAEPRPETWDLSWEASSPRKAMEAMALDLRSEGLGSSAASPVKPWANVLTSLGFGFLISKVGSSSCLVGLLGGLITGLP